MERYRDRSLPPAQIARELGVDGIIEGSVFRSGDSLRVEIRLLDGDSGLRLWTGRYAGSLRSDVLALPSRAAAGIIAAVGAEPAGSADPGSKTAGGRDPRAERAFLRGRYEFVRQNDLVPQDSASQNRHLRAAVRDFEEAATIEPAWAAAHAWLARSYHFMASIRTWTDSSAFYFERSKTEALRAVSLDESLAEGYGALGFVLFAYEHDWVGAEWAIRRSIELEPSSVNHWAYALYLVAVGRLDEAIEQYEEVQKRDPVSPEISRQVAWAYACAGRYDEAITQFELRRQWVREEGPNAGISRAYAYAHASRYDEAIAVLEEGIARSDSSSWYVAGLAYVEARAGAVEEARALQRWLDERDPSWKGAFPETLAAVGDLELAADSYQRLIQRDWSSAVMMRCNPAYPYLRDDLRGRAARREHALPGIFPSGPSALKVHGAERPRGAASIRRPGLSAITVKLRPSDGAGPSRIRRQGSCRRRHGRWCPRRGGGLKLTRFRGHRETRATYPRDKVHEAEDTTTLSPGVLGTDGGVGEGEVGLQVLPDDAVERGGASRRQAGGAAGAGEWRAGSIAMLEEKDPRTPASCPGRGPRLSSSSTTHHQHRRPGAPHGHGERLPPAPAAHRQHACGVSCH